MDDSRVPTGGKILSDWRIHRRHRTPWGEAPRVRKRSKKHDEFQLKKMKRLRSGPWAGILLNPCAGAAGYECRPGKFLWTGRLRRAPDRAGGRAGRLV